MSKEDKKNACEELKDALAADGFAELRAVDPCVGFEFDPRTLQWVESDVTYEFNDNGDIIYSHETSYSVPDMSPIELYEYIRSDMEPIYGLCSMENACEGCGCEDDEEFSEDDRFKLSPKGVALMACIESEIVSDLNDPRFDKFWDIFQKEMIRNGYAEEDE